MLGKLFGSYGFVEDEVAVKNVALFKNAKSTQFYLVAEYLEQDFLDYDNAKITEEIINLYAELKATSPVISKNSSLIILVRCANYQPNEELLNKIYAVEEDPFGMRKYVIAAQNDIIDRLKDIDSDELTKIVSNKDRFDKYQTNGLANSDHEYMGALQVYIKLPFLKMEEGRAQLQTITERIDALMQKDNNQHLKEQNLTNGSVFDDREKFLSNALSLQRNELDDWLDETLEVVG